MSKNNRMNEEKIPVDTICFHKALGKARPSMSQDIAPSSFFKLMISSVNNPFIIRGAVQVDEMILPVFDISIPLIDAKDAACLNAVVRRDASLMSRVPFFENTTFGISFIGTANGSEENGQ